MTYTFSKRSEEKLFGVHPALVAIVRHALRISEVDFAVTCGVRTLEEQKQMVVKGASKTLASKHLIQADGHSHAVDIAPFINGGLRWDYGACEKVAEAMKAAAVSKGFGLEWGGAWGFNLLHYNGTPGDAHKEYIAKRIHDGKKPFIDAFHFQLKD